MKRTIAIRQSSGMLAFVVMVLAAATAPAAESTSLSTGFVSLIDDDTLAGWRGDTDYFEVRDGAIVAGSEQPIPKNTFLIHEKPHAVVAFDATDLDPLARTDGLIGIQVHAGDPMLLEVKDMVIKSLTSLPDLRRFVTDPGPAPEPAVTYKDSTRVAMPDQPLQ